MTRYLFSIPPSVMTTKPQKGTTPESESAAAQPKGNRPLAVFRDPSQPAVSASVFRNEITRKDGTEADIFKVVAGRSYKDKSDNWQHTQSFGLRDMDALYRTLKQAEDFMKACVAATALEQEKNG